LNACFRVAALLLLAGTAGCEPISPHAPFPIDPPIPSKVGASVLESVSLGEEVRVMVALEQAQPAIQPASPEGVASVIRSIGEVADELIERIGPEDLEFHHRFRAVPALALTVRSQAALQRLAADPAVRRIDLDEGGSGALAESISHIGVDRRHARGNDGEGVVVAVLDSGIDAAHPELTGALVHEACFGFRGNGGGFCHNGTSRDTGPGSAQDDAGHGTHVTGIVAARGIEGPPGVAPGASIVAIKVLDDCSFSGCFSAFSEIVAALDHLIQNQAVLDLKVINMSLGTSALFDGICDQTTAGNMAAASAINMLMALGVITFASSMNNRSSTQMASPACLSNVIAVGAVDAEDEVAPFSNSNSFTELLAPGVQIYSLAIGGGVRRASGTSMASPHAAGCAALLIQTTPAITPGALRGRMKATGAPISDLRNELVHPRIDCAPGPLLPRSTVPIPRPGD